jgi:hypothetical protein
MLKVVASPKDDGTRGVVTAPRKSLLERFAVFHRVLSQLRALAGLDIEVATNATPNRNLQCVSHAPVKGTALSANKEPADAR